MDDMYLLHYSKSWVHEIFYRLCVRNVSCYIEDHSIITSAVLAKQNLEFKTCTLLQKKHTMSLHCTYLPAYSLEHMAILGTQYFTQFSCNLPTLSMCQCYDRRGTGGGRRHCSIY